MSTDSISKLASKILIGTSRVLIQLEEENRIAYNPQDLLKIVEIYEHQA